jgi:hypothetical protein
MRECVHSYGLQLEPLSARKRCNSFTLETTVMTNLITIGLTAHMVAEAELTTVEVPMVTSEVIARATSLGIAEINVRRSATFVRSQIAGQPGTLSTSERRHITSFARVQETSEIVRTLRPTSKASWFTMKA